MSLRDLVELEESLSYLSGQERALTAAIGDLMEAATGCDVTAVVTIRDWYRDAAEQARSEIEEMSNER